MSRLTVYEKRKAVAAMLIETQTQKMSDVQELYFAKSHTAYRTYFGKDYQKMLKLPKGWLRISNDHSARVNGQYIYLSFEAKEKWRIGVHDMSLVFDMKFKQGKLPLNYPFPHNPGNISLRSGDEHFDVFVEAQEAYQSLEEAEREIKNLFAKCVNAMSSIRTYKQAKNTWPEIAKYLTMPDSAPLKANLPAVNFTDLNEKLGLPA